MILLLDNYDSFTFNLVHFLGELGADCDVRRNDSLSVEEAVALRPDGIVISPGPGRPEAAGISAALVKRAGPQLPILGVCLGHQAIGQAHGASIRTAEEILHGKTSRIRHFGDRLFDGVDPEFEATRYHSLALCRDSLPGCLEITAEAEDGEIMAVRHRQWPTFGVQFHPESIATACGKAILRNFLSILRDRRCRTPSSR